MVQLDKVTLDLLKDGYIMQSQVTRLLNKGVSAELILRDITLSGFMTKERLTRYIVEKIRNGEYQLSIINTLDAILTEADVLKKLANELQIQFVDLDSIDMDYKLIERLPLTQLKKYNALPIYEDDLSITVVFNDPLNIEAQEAIQRLFPY